MARDDPAAVSSDAGRVPAWFWKACHLTAGVLLPGACIALSFDIGLAPYWQSGSFHDFVGYLFTGGIAFAFFPLMLYSMLAMVLMLFWRERFVRLFAVRFGVYSGAVLAGLYAAKASAFFVVPLWLVAIVVPLLLRAFLLWMDRVGRWRNLYLWAPPGLWGMALLAGFLFAIGSAVALPAVTVVAALASAPYLAFLSYVLMSRETARTARDIPTARNAWAAGITVWATAYLGAWAMTVRRAMDHYSALPTHDPSCYIATAAARGHVGVVGSQRLRLAGGGVMTVNGQLRNLKLAEIALGALAPRLHRACRGLYDLFGPALAREIRSPITADLAYLALKPIEWAARAVLGVIVPDADALARKLYR